MDTSTQDGQAMAIIAYAGEGRSLAFQALSTAKKGMFEAAYALLKQSDEALVLAHQAQTTLLFNEVNGVKHVMNVLLVHAQDHLMSALLANELIKEMVEIYSDRSKNL